MEPGIAPKRRGRPPVKLNLKPAPIPRQEADVDEDIVSSNGPDTSRPAMRTAMRPEMRQEDSRARAARRTAEILGNLKGELVNEGYNEFSAPDAPPGWTYEWKTKSVLNQEQYSYQSELKRTGWQEVPSTRHPEMVPEDKERWPVIEKKGLVLMERPVVITDKVRQAERRKAAEQISAKKAQLGETKPGQFGPDDPRVRPSVKNSYSPVAVPEDT